MTTISFEPCMTPFRIETSECNPDICIDVSTKNVDNVLLGNKIYESDNVKVYRKGSVTIRLKSVILRNVKTKVAFAGMEGDDRYYRLCVFGEETGPLFAGANILNYLALEEILLSNNAFILHSSFVAWRGNGILFSAPSGTGKSTQADLWKQYEGAEIYNGDRTVIRKIDGVYYGFGSPYAGSSGIYRNETAPIRAIIILSQAAENHMGQLTGKGAFMPLYRETLMNTWNPVYMEAITDLLMDAAVNIPIYHLACRPDKGAVELVKEILI